MLRPATVAVAVAILVLNGALHGVWTHRWDTLSDSAVLIERIEQIPLQAGAWKGERVPLNPLTLPEEVVGRGVTIEYKNQIDGSVVTVFLTCGPTEGVISHTPRACYVANGYDCPVEDFFVTPPGREGTAAKFGVSTFSKDEHAPMRVLWAWSDGRSGWQVPNNPGRAFRRSAVIYKCYAIRTILGTDEPLSGDPGLDLLAVLLPKLDAVLSGAPAPDSTER